MKKNFIFYWVVTAIFSAFMLFGGIGDILLLEQVKGAVDKLRYPEYFIRALGFWKVAGVLVILLPFFKKLKEWAYAGFTINLSMAVYSHIFVGDAISEIIKPFIPLILMCISYYLYHQKIKEEKIV